MIKSNEAQHDYRFGDSGPKYLIRGPMCDMGVVMLQPGQSFSPTIGTSKRAKFFIPLAGEVTLYLNGEPYTLGSGGCDALRSRRSTFSGEQRGSAVERSLCEIASYTG